MELPSIFRWAMDLGASPLCSAGERPTPLVFDGGARLYLARYWRYQAALARGLRQRVQQRPDDLHPERLRAGLDRLFRDGGSTGPIPGSAWPRSSPPAGASP